MDLPYTASTTFVTKVVLGRSYLYYIIKIIGQAVDNFKLKILGVLPHRLIRRKISPLRKGGD